jgi:hypothetical protein
MLASAGVAGLIGQQIATRSQLVAQPACIVVDSPSLLAKSPCEVERNVLKVYAARCLPRWYPVPTLVAGDLKIARAAHHSYENPVIGAHKVAC